ncbi:unnamed protein product [Lampetra fluviatilis]
MRILEVGSVKGLAHEFAFVCNPRQHRRHPWHVRHRRPRLISERNQRLAGEICGSPSLPPWRNSRDTLLEKFAAAHPSLIAKWETRGEKIAAAQPKCRMDIWLQWKSAAAESHPSKVTWILRNLRQQNDQSGTETWPGEICSSPISLQNGDLTGKIRGSHASPHICSMEAVGREMSIGW